MVTITFGKRTVIRIETVNCDIIVLWIRGCENLEIVLLFDQSMHPLLQFIRMEEADATANNF